MFTTHIRWLKTLSSTAPDNMRFLFVMSYTGSSTPAQTAALWAVGQTPLKKKERKSVL